MGDAFIGIAEPPVTQGGLMWLSWADGPQPDRLYIAVDATCREDGAVDYRLLPDPDNAIDAAG